MGELVTTFLILIGGFTSLLGCKYLMYRCEKDSIENTILIESIDESIDEVPPKYEDIT